MACSLTDNGLQCTANTGSVVTVKVVAKATTLVLAEYNGAAIPLVNNSTTFTVVAGNALLLLNLAGAQDTVEIVEDCGGGKTNHLFGYSDDFHPALGFTIVGN
jgi:hypothetical protein